VRGKVAGTDYLEGRKSSPLQELLLQLGVSIITWKKSRRRNLEKKEKISIEKESAVRREGEGLQPPCESHKSVLGGLGFVCLGVLGSSHSPTGPFFEKKRKGNLERGGLPKS